MNDYNLMTKNNIKNTYGMTDTMFDDFIASKIAPSGEVPNYRYRSIKYPGWSLEAVDEAINNDEYRAAKKKRDEQHEKRQAAGLKAAETKEQKTAELVETWPIEIEKLDDDVLRRTAIEHAFEIARMHNNRVLYDYYDSDVEKWVVNYLRHTAPKYDERFNEIKSKVGKSDAVNQWHERVLKEIANKYPKYADEAHRQIVEKLNSRRY